MKVVCSGNNALNLSAIQSVSVSDADGKIKIVVRHQGKKAEKVSCINFRRIIHFHPHIKMSSAFAEDIVAEIEHLLQQPSLPIEHVIGFKAWRVGCLGVDLQTATDAQKTSALARLCCDWSVGGRNTPPEKQLEVRTGLDTDTITRITATDTYTQHIKEILFKGSPLFKPRTAEEFKAWIEKSDNISTQLGKRLRMSKETVLTLIRAIAREHRIEEDWILRRISIEMRISR